ncbi:hypothetical protein DW083_17495 [Parabacteroides sp. AF48-14]|nr:hypothetical protein DW083_17495 [Parabacteroides sp. AF48-14]
MLYPDYVGLMVDTGILVMENQKGLATKECSGHQVVALDLDIDMEGMRIKPLHLVAVSPTVSPSVA